MQNSTAILNLTAQMCEFWKEDLAQTMQTQLQNTYFYGVLSGAAATLFAIFIGYILWRKFNAKP